MESPSHDQLTKGPLASHGNGTPGLPGLLLLTGLASSASRHRPAAYLVLPSSLAT